MRANPTLLELLFNIFMWLFILIISRQSFVKPYLLRKKELYFLYFCLFLFCLFPFMTGDYFHYLDEYNEVKKGGYSHLEYVYIFIIDNFCSSYHIFRFIVWGIALLLTIYGYRRLLPKNDLELALLGILFIPWFAYARVTLSMSCIFLGLTYFANPLKGKKTIGYIIGILLIAISFYFHRSSIIGIAAAVLSVCIRRPTPKHIFIMILVFPGIIYVVSRMLNQFVLMEFDDMVSEGMINTYLESDRGSSRMGIGELIYVMLLRLPLFMIGFTYILSVFQDRLKYFNKTTQLVSSYMFFIVLIAFVFTFDLGFNTYTLYYRTLNYAIIPSVVFLSQIRIHKFFPKMFKLIMIITIMGLTYTFLYSFYLSRVILGDSFYG